MNSEEIKKRLGTHVVDNLVKSGMKLGLGTGSTAVWAVRRIGEHIKEGTLENILAVPTSFQTVLECEQWGIPCRSLNDSEIKGELDFSIDGADEVDGNLNLIKGGGGALLIEKIVAYASRKYAIIVTSDKLVENLGMKFPIPLEVVSEARVTVIKAVEALGVKPEIRMAV
ncbi:MAG: ribose 5-phosphate isomerase A, partial [Spirochaetota bacterium]